jgi:hypothetical protein
MAQTHESTNSVPTTTVEVLYAVSRISVGPHTDLDADSSETPVLVGNYGATASRHCQGT